MNVDDTSLEKPVLYKGSAYLIRNAYLRAIQQLMAGKERTSSLVHPAEIDHYLRYEKRISLHLQEHLSGVTSQCEQTSPADSSLDL
jgi:hypothetical protein